MNIYQLDREHQLIINGLYNQDTGEINETALGALNLNEKLTQEKAISLVKWTRNMAAEVAAIAEARKAMQAREKALSNKIDFWEDQIFEAMKKRGIEEISCPYFVIDIVKNPCSTDITDKDIIPDKFIKRVVEEKVDKDAIKRAIKDGEIVPGAQLIQTERLRIK